MASRYIQKYPIPDGFPLILKNFSRELLRDQPPNIIEYAAKYFQQLEKGEIYQYKSPYNVEFMDKRYELQYDPVPAQQMQKKDLRINGRGTTNLPGISTSLDSAVNSIFLQFDVNNDGALEAKEVRELTNALFKNGHLEVLPNETEIEKFIASVDENRNGKLERDEFKKFLSKWLT